MSWQLFDTWGPRPWRRKEERGHSQPLSPTLLRGSGFEPKVKFMLCLATLLTPFIFMYGLSGQLLQWGQCRSNLLSLLQKRWETR